MNKLLKAPKSRAKSLRRSAVVAVVTAPTLALVPSSARAQAETTLIRPSIPTDYDRGRNVSVMDRPRPDYDPLGIRAGGFLIYPRVETAAGYSSNIFLSENNPTSDVFVGVAPTVRVTSDWSRNQLTGTAGTRQRFYLNNSRRNQNEWNLGILGRYDIGVPYSITAEVQAEQLQEDPFSGEADANLASLSQYRRALGSLRGEYKAGRIKAIGAYDYSAFRFDPIDFGAGRVQSQILRDRDIHRATAQLEYALSPSLSVYGQANYIVTRYTAALPAGFVARDSDSVRFIGGVNFDLAGFMRGSVGVGYTRRNYLAPAFADAGGFSVEGKLEYFPSELTTVTATARRVLEDTSIASVSAFFDTRASLRVDHELRRNLVLNAGAEFSRQDFIDSPLKNDTYRVRGGGRYLLSRQVQIGLDGSFAHRTRDGGATRGSLNEAGAVLSLIVQI